MASDVVILDPPERRSDFVLLYVPGSPSVDPARELAERTGARVYCPLYKPVFPRSFQDVEAAYDQANIGPMIIVGERMGAGLAAALLVHLRDLGAPLPRAAVLISALLDLTMRANSVELNSRADPQLDITALRGYVADYAGGEALTNPLLSPLYANLHGLPPVQLLVAGTDPLLDDSLSFTARSARSGVTVDLRVSPDAATLASNKLPVTAEFVLAHAPAADPPLARAV
jgi:acetyl esterase/lipase